MNSPPAFASANIGYRYDCSNLGAYAKPTTARYSTRALSITLITVVKQLDRVEIQSTGIDNDGGKDGSNDEEGCMMENGFGSEGTNIEEFVPPLAHGSLAGNGVVTVKRTVHGYKKLSLVNRVEVRA